MQSNRPWEHQTSFLEDNHGGSIEYLDTWDAAQDIEEQEENFDYGPYGPPNVDPSAASPVVEPHEAPPLGESQLLDEVHATQRFVPLSPPQKKKKKGKTTESEPGADSTLGHFFAPPEVGWVYPGTSS